MTTLLLLSMLLSAGAAPVLDAVNAPSSAVMSTDSTFAVPEFLPKEPLLLPSPKASTWERLEWEQPNRPENAQRVCLKIRAYVFELNDDHAPKFVKQTTCGPDNMRTESVGGAGEPKLVPAVGGRQAR